MRQQKRSYAVWCAPCVRWPNGEFIECKGDRTLHHTQAVSKASAINNVRARIAGRYATNHGGGVFGDDGYFLKFTAVRV